MTQTRPKFEIQNLLLALGTSLVAIAVVVFTAVNWRRLDATAQGLVLVGLTASAAVAARTASRRQMPGTAEALGIVAVLLALADVHALRVGFAPNVDARQVWAGGLALVAAGAWRFGASTGIRGPQVGAAILVQVPVVLVLSSAGAGRSLIGVAVVGQAAAVAFAAPRQAKAVAVAAGATSAVLTGVALLVAVADAITRAGPELLGPASVLAASSVAGAWICWLRAEEPTWRDPALTSSTVLLLVAGYTALLGYHSPAMALAGVGSLAAVMMAAGSWAPKPWRETPAIVGGIGASISLIPLLASVASMLVAASEVPTRAWMLQAATPAADLRLDAQSAQPTVVALEISTFLLVLVAGRRLARRRSWLPQATVAAVVVLAIAPLVAPLTIGATVASGLGLVVAMAVAVVLASTDRAVRRTAAATGAVGLGWAATWSLATPELTATALGVALVAALMVAITATVVDDVDLARPSLALVLGSAAGLTGVIASLAGVRPSMAWALAGVTGAVVGAVGRSKVLEVSSLTVHVAALYATAVLGDAEALSIVLATGAIALAVHATRPGRLPLLAAAAGEGLLLTWLRLDAAEVYLVEAYTLPLALLLLAAGTITEVQRRRTVASWTTIGPGLVVALVPTTYLALVEPGSVRPLVGLVAGTVVLVAGAVWSRRAAVDLGASVVVVLGARQLAPVVGALPNWATIGTTGIVLIAAGATFEQRRRDLRVARRRYSSLR